MLHELLLSLYGHPSPLLSDNPPQSVTSLCSPTELSLLRSLTTLGTLHAEIRSQCASFATLEQTKKATVVPAIADAILDGPLRAFQQRVRDVESNILKEDASLVGAYRAVPLASVVAKFEGQRRLLEWLRGLTTLMRDGDGADSKIQPGSKVLDYLRKETRTGYPDIGDACIDLLKVGEETWVRQLVGWLLYGRFPDAGAEDFFIHATTDGLEVRQDLLPKFVNPSAAASILFIGRSVRYVHEYLQQNSNIQMSIDLNSLRINHLEQITSMPIPLTPIALARTMSSIRISLAQNALQTLLPLSRIHHMLRVLREFFLLERGEFAMALISVVDLHLVQRSGDSVGGSRDPRVLSGALIKEAELSNILNKTWSALLALEPDLTDAMVDWEDEVLETARDVLELQLRKSQPPKPTSLLRLANETLFDDVLLGIPAILTMQVSAPLDIFLSPSNIQTYTQIHSYLLALRRTNVHLTGLTTLSVLRRTYPSAPGPPISGERLVATVNARNRNFARTQKLRHVWAVVKECIIVLSEMTSYFQGEVVVESGAAFDEWMSPTKREEDTDSESSRLRNVSDLAETKGARTGSLVREVSSDMNTKIGKHTKAGRSYSHDPATLKSAHRRYLYSLATALLIHDATFLRGVRDVLTRAEHLVALMHRLSHVTQAIMTAEALSDVSTAESEDIVSKNLAKEEHTLGENLDQADDQLRKSLRHMLARMKALDEEQMHEGIANIAIGVGTGASNKIAEDELVVEETDDFVPWVGPGIGRLIMRLEMANVDGLTNSDRAL